MPRDMIDYYAAMTGDHLLTTRDRCLAILPFIEYHDGAFFGERAEDTPRGARIAARLYAVNTEIARRTDTEIEEM